MTLSLRIGLLFVIVCVGGGSGAAWAQGPVEPGAYGGLYRPPGVEYRVTKSPHFDLIYQEGAYDMARRTAAALEETRAATNAMVGPVPDDWRMPVVINDFNDRSNGFVTPFPFRQEIETPSIKSDQLVARSSSWPALVAPHELVHAAQAEVNAGVGVGGLLRLFAPDMARGLNLLGPVGLVEGVAVYRESQIEPGAGRLNAPLFTMKMRAALLSDDPWSLTQMLEPPAYTQPTNRFYIGGAHAFEYLAERGDSVRTDFFQTTTTWYNRLPFLGGGMWLGVGTGQFPTSLRNELQSELEADYRAALDRRAPFTPTERIAGDTGLNHRRPYWIDADTLVAYVHGYSVRPGFYRIDAKTGERAPVRIQTLTEDRQYSLGPDTTALYAGRYVQDPWVSQQAIAEVERISLSDGGSTRLTDGGRAFAPAPGPDGTLYAITNDGPFTRWVSIANRDSIAPLTRSTPRSIRQIAPSPRDSTIAVLVNEKGKQRLYRAQAPVSAPADLTPWFGIKDAIIYDVSWGPDGRYLLFAADHSEVANVFAYDTDTNRVLQLANVRYGALEPALSPDQSAVAFIKYRHERHDLVRMPFRPDSATVVPDSLVRRGAFEDRTAEKRTTSTRSMTADTLTGSRPYAAWRHLTPRMVYPVLQGEGDEEPLADIETLDSKGPLGLGVGLGVQGADPLQRWTYRASSYWQDGRIWGEARVESGAFLLRPSLSLYNRAFTTFIRDGDQRQSVAVEERGAGLGLRVPVALESNVYQSRLRFGLDGELRQVRFRDEDLASSRYSTRLTLQPSATFQYRVQQNVRDLVPNTGLVVGLQGELDAWTESQSPGQGMVAAVDTYVPVLKRTNTGARFGLRALVQNRSSIFNTSRFVPRGYGTVSTLPAGPSLQFETEITQPLWYIDDGLTLLPIYLKSLAGYGFGETLGVIENGGWNRALSTVGGGLSLETRFFYRFNLTLRIGAAYRFETNDFAAVYR